MVGPSRGAHEKQGESENGGRVLEGIALLMKRQGY